MQRIFKISWRASFKNLGAADSLTEQGDAILVFTYITDFLTFLQRPRKGIKQIVCLSHYGSGYDNVFILKKMISERKWNIKIISKGCKLISIKYGIIHFKDGIYWLYSSLSKLPKMLRLQPASIQIQPIDIRFKSALRTQFR